MATPYERLGALWETFTGRRGPYTDQLRARGSTDSDLADAISAINDVMFGLKDLNKDEVGRLASVRAVFGGPPKGDQNILESKAVFGLGRLTGDKTKFRQWNQKIISV